MTTETTAFRLERQLKFMDECLVRLGKVAERIEAATAPVEEVPLDQEAKEAEALAEKWLEKRTWEAQQLAERFNSGSLSDEEIAEYMDRWTKTSQVESHVG